MSHPPLTQISLDDVQEDPSLIERISQQAHDYGVYRGEASAGGDRHGMLGGPSFDSVVKDYLQRQFGVKGDLIHLSTIIPSIPNPVLAHLRKGFDEGYRRAFYAYEDDL